MAYGHVNWLTYRQQLASRLGDSGNVFYTDAELALYTVESLRTWQALTGYWRDRGTFNTTNQVAFYDLTTALQAGLYDYNVKDQDLVSVMEYHLLEPANVWTGSSAWAGTDMFVMTDLVNALQRKRDQFLKDTGAVLTNASISTSSPPSGRFTLADKVIDVRRLAWKDALSGFVSPLFRDTEFSFNAFRSGWSVNPMRPLAYSVLASPPLTVQSAPIPISSGSLDLTSVNAGAVLNVGNGVLLGVPDNFSWVIKWGALSDLFQRDGQSRDSLRGDYCRQRYEDGVLLARMSSSVLNAQIDGIDIQTESLHDLDVYNPSWQNGAGTPQVMAIAGMNLIALGGPVPNAGPYSATVDIVRNAVIPLSDTDFIQLGREELDVVLDYSQHIASLKMGGAEFQATLPLYQKFIQAASTYNDRLKSSGVYAGAMGTLSQRETNRNPRRQSDTSMNPVFGG